jgi:hypothetical protein
MVKPNKAHLPFKDNPAFPIAQLARSSDRSHIRIGCSMIDPSDCHEAKKIREVDRGAAGQK